MAWVMAVPLDIAFVARELEACEKASFVDGFHKPHPAAQGGTHFEVIMRGQPTGGGCALHMPGRREQQPASRPAGPLFLSCLGGTCQMFPKFPENTALSPTLVSVQAWEEAKA